MKRLSKLITLLLCLALPWAALAEAAEDPVIVRVGRVEYPLSVASYSYQSNLDLLAYQGYSPTVAEREELRQQTVDHLVELALIENKLMEHGQNDLTEAEDTLLRSYAGNLYESLWQGLKQRAEAAGQEVTEEQVTTWLTQQGYTLDMVYQEALVNVRNERILGLYCADVTITPEEIEAYYRENFLNPDREAYENDIPRYEQEILTAGNESFYTPEGYRVIRQILLPFPDEVVSAVNAIAPYLEEQASQVEDAYSAVADAALSGDGLEEAKAAYRQAVSAYSELLAQVDALEQQALPLLQETTDEIIRRYQAGESFEALIAAYASEAGEQAGAELLFHPDSEQWAEVFRQQVTALEKPGDITGPFVTTLGVHIVQYQSDYPGGEYALTAEEQQALEASALQAKQMEELRTLMADWRNQYTIETWPERLGI